MRVLVAGGTGFIGSAIVRLLLGEGHEIHVIARPSSSPHRISTEDVRVHSIDLVDVDSVAACLKSVRPDSVVNAAAEPGHPTTPQEILSAWRGTTLGTVSLLESLREALPEKVVHLGSALEYAPSRDPHTESSPEGPVNVRGLTKLAAAQALQAWSLETRVPSSNLRVFSAYGRSEQSGRLVPSLLRALRDQTPFFLTKTVTRRDFVDVREVARAVSMVLQGENVEPTLNIGTGVEHSVPDVVTVAESVTGKSLTIGRGNHPGSAADRDHLYADPTLAAETLGWAARVTLEEGLRSEWVRMS